MNIIEIPSNEYFQNKANILSNLIKCTKQEIINITNLKTKFDNAGCTPSHIFDNAIIDFSDRPHVDKEIQAMEELLIVSVINSIYKELNIPHYLYRTTTKELRFSINQHNSTIFNCIKTIVINTINNQQFYIVNLILKIRTYILTDNKHNITNGNINNKIELHQLPPSYGTHDIFTYIDRLWYIIDNQKFPQSNNSTLTTKDTKYKYFDTYNNDEDEIVICTFKDIELLNKVNLISNLMLCK